MRIRVLISFFLALAFLFQGSTFAKAATSVNLFQITTDSSQQSTPAVFRDKVIWTDWRNSATTDLDIFQYDLRTHIESPLIVKPGQQWAVGLDEKYVVYNQYTDGDPKSYDVHLYNLRNGQDTAVTDDIGSQTATDFDGDTIVYIDGGACGKLYTYDIRNKTKKLITETACGPAKVWENTVVWAYAAPNGSNVYGYDLRRNRQFDIATADGFQDSPDIYEDKVVWLDYTTGARGDYNAIKMKDLETGKVKTIYESTTDALNWPAISNKYIVWSQSSAPNVGGVRGANIRTGEVFEVQSQGPHQNSTTTPAIWSNTAVWAAWRTGGGDIYGGIFNKE